MAILRVTAPHKILQRLANYADGEKRRFDSYKTEADALAAANILARRIDSRDYVAASMTRDQAIEYADAVTALKPFNLNVKTAACAVAGCLTTLGDLAKAKTASRRIVPIHDNLAAWLARYAERQGNVWGADSITFTNRERQTAAATAYKEKGLKRVNWKHNERATALRVAIWRRCAIMSISIRFGPDCCAQKTMNP